MNINSSKKGEFGLINLIITIIVTSIITSLTTGIIIYNNNKDNEALNADKLKNDETLQEFLTVYRSVLDNYYEDVDKEKMVDEAISAMLNYLGDDYTTYLNENETDSLTEKLAGIYKGIGVSLTEGNKIYSIFENSPAAEVGLKIGDAIIKVNDIDVSTFTASEIAEKIKTSDPKIKITVLRGEEEISFDVERKEIIIPAVSSKVIDNQNVKTGYISISTFSNTVAKQFKEELEEIEKQNIDNLIIDVRDNTGGYLKAASDIASLFLEKGKTIYSLESKNNKESFSDETSERRNYKISILINGNTASASEILAAALKDSYGASLVGAKSYGKGKVQQTHSLEDGSMVKYTSAKWLTPSGTCIDKVGLTPDYEASLILSEDGTSYEDGQLNKALEILRN